MPEKMEGRRLGKFISGIGKLEGNEGQRQKFQCKKGSDDLIKSFQGILVV